MEKITFHKCVLNVMIAPTPTQYTKSDKYRITTQKSKLVRNGVLGGEPNVAIAVTWPAAGKQPEPSLHGLAQAFGSGPGIIQEHVE